VYTVAAGASVLWMKFAIYHRAAEFCHRTLLHSPWILAHRPYTS